MATSVQDYANEASVQQVYDLIGALPAPTDPDLLKQILVAIAASSQGGTTTVRVANGSSFDIPQYDYMAFTYVNGTTNNIHTQTFKSGGSGGTTVATLTFTYISGGVADDDRIATITQS
jgi:hypothetical protein